MTLASTLLLALLTAANPSSDGGAPEAILLDFQADWCGPCRQMAPAIDRLGRQGYPIRKINIDRSPAMAQKYGVEAVPTFIVVDADGREMDRTSGLQPASALEQFYLNARDRSRAKAHAQTVEEPREDPSEIERPARRVRRTAQQPETDDQPIRDLDSDDDRTRVETDDDQPETKAKAFTNPHPVETTVRIKVQAPHSVGFGSGTIIYSSPEVSIVLTCAHIFKQEGRSRQAAPGQFPLPITIELFDGKLHQQPSGPPKARCVAAFPGKALDYDFNLDVGLIVFRPGRKLPSSRVVPTYWQPQSKPLPMKMLTVGCSEGDDATAWYTRVMNPRLKGFLQGQPSYEAIECEHAPKQGRSGGGLFTTNGYIAGVCNFAEPQGDHGLYATPRSIYSILDRNNLSALYAPVSAGTGTLLAERGRPSPAPAPTRVARTQSPDVEDESKPEPSEGGSRSRSRRTAEAETGDILLPHYRRLGIEEPVGTDGEAAPTPSHSARRVAWHPNRTTGAPRPEAEPKAEPRVETSGSATTEPTRRSWRPVHDAGQ